MKIMFDTFGTSAMSKMADHLEATELAKQTDEDAIFSGEVLVNGNPTTVHVVMVKTQDGTWGVLRIE